MSKILLPISRGSKFDTSERMGRSAVSLLAGTSPGPWDLAEQHEYLTTIRDANNSVVCECRSDPNSRKSWFVHNNDAYLIAGAHEMRTLLYDMKTLGGAAEVEAWLDKRDLLLAWIDGDPVKPEKFTQSPAVVPTGPSNREEPPHEDYDDSGPDEETEPDSERDAR